jgi:putative hemolysin
MSHYATIAVIVISLTLSGIFATLTYALRDFSRTRLSEILTRRGTLHRLEPTIEHASELAFITASVRLICNLGVLLGLLYLFDNHGWSIAAQYSAAAGCSAVLTIAASVTLPHALATHVGEPVIALLAGPLHALRVVMRPLSKLLQVTDHVVRRAASSSAPPPERANEQLQSEILAVVHEGAKDGVVDATERQMIESVVQFRDTAVMQVMTARPDIIGLPVDADLERIRGLMEESGHSRIPLSDGSLDHIVGILYARDLLKYVGETPDKFDIRQVMRPPFFVPESKPLRDLLQDFRLQKVHIAIVLDEYGGTAGLVTIEDVLEELVGEISDEHEPIERAIFHRIDDNTADVDAKIHVDELNRLLGTNLPEDDGYDTLGGYVSTHLGRIPQAGTAFEAAGAGFVILEAEPQRVTRVKVQIIQAVP